MKRAVVSVGSGAAKALAAVSAAGVDAALVAADSDLQTLKRAGAPKKFQLGKGVLKGLGASGDPDVAREAAQHDAGELASLFAGYEHVVVLVGLGGGTGTGAAPVVCRAARSAGARGTVVAGWPVAFEGMRRRRQAEEGLEVLRGVVDEVVVVDVQPDVAERNGLTMTEAFALADARMVTAVRSALGG